MKPIRIFIAITAIYITVYAAHSAYLGKTVYGDGIYYYSWLRSILVDHDINFANEYRHFAVTQPKSSIGVLSNKYSIGPAILWAPLFITIHTIVRSDGYTAPYQIAVSVTTIFYTILALILLYRILPGAPATRLLGIITIAGATNLFFYGSVDPINSHALSFFAATLYLNFLLSPSPNWVAVGVSLALLSSIRLQDIVFIFLLLPYGRKKQLWQCMGGFLLGFTPQLLAWSALYGNPWTNPYLAGGESFALSPKHILGVLFSPENGLYLWTPVSLIGTIGLYIKRKLYGNYLLVFLLELMVVASWSTWWQGASFSGRMFVSSLPLLAFGMAPGITRLFQALGQTVTTLFVATFVSLNILSILYFLFIH